MILTEARETVRDGVLHISQNTFEDAKIDRAIRFPGNDFVNHTKCTRATADVAITSSTPALDITATSGMSAFHPGQLINCRIGTRRPLDVVDFNYMLHLHENHTASGRPTHIAFNGPGDALLYPTPDANYTLKVTWDEPFTVWTPGDNDPDNITLNIPDRYIDAVLWFGASAALVYGEAGSLYASTGWAHYSTRNLTG